MPNYHELEIAAALDHVEETLRLARERRSLTAQEAQKEPQTEGPPSEDDGPTWTERTTQL